MICHAVRAQRPPFAERLKSGCREFAANAADAVLPPSFLKLANAAPPYRISIRERLTRSSATMSTVCLGNGHRYFGDNCGIAERSECTPDHPDDRNGFSAAILPANLLEASSIVVDSRKGEAGGRELDLLIYRADIEIVPVDQDQAEIARIAWRRFGKARHPAALNYGDCFAYALAKSRRLPLLCLGGDFAQTDIETVL
jgi:ribonuclease VapC